jgi:hypothetical protein
MACGGGDVVACGVSEFDQAIAVSVSQLSSRGSKLFGLTED